MIFVFLICFIILLFNSNFFHNNTDDFLSRNNTLTINGIFVLLVLFSHFNSYVEFSGNLDIFYYNIFQKIGQLMVTTFLFFSGYGIFESIKSKENYINSFFKKRFLPLFISFSLIIIFYVILNLFLENSYSLKIILLSFTGWESIGNSNWFMFATFYLYIATIISFKISNNKVRGIILTTIFSILYIVLVYKFKGNFSWWFNTILCYPAGMFFSLFKTIFLNFIKDKRNYYLLFILISLLFGLCYFSCNNYLIYEIYSILFVLIIILLNYKFCIGNKISMLLGKNTFNIYCLQRLSFILVSTFQITNIYLYFFISIIFIFIFVFIFNKLNKFLLRALKLK